MPYEIKKQGDEYLIVNKKTGKVVGHSRSAAQAQRSINARNAIEHGWKKKKS